MYQRFIVHRIDRDVAHGGGGIYIYNCIYIDILKKRKLVQKKEFSGYIKKNNGVTFDIHPSITQFTYPSTFASVRLSFFFFIKKKKHTHKKKQFQLPALFNFPEINVGALFCVYTLKPTTMELSSSNTSSIGIGGDGGSGGGGGDKGRPKSIGGGGGSGP